MFCLFCNRQHDDVAKLFGGNRYYICDQCVLRFRQALADENDAVTQAIEMLSSDIGRTITERADVTASLEACLRLAKTRTELLEELAVTALRVDRPDMALKILSTVGPEARDLNWHGLVSTARHNCGDFVGALRALDAVDLADAQPIDQLLVRAARIHSRIKTNPGENWLVSQLPELEVLRVDAALVRDRGVALEVVDIVRAECFLRLGQPQKAERILRDAARRSSLSSSSLVLFGDCLHELGRTGEAKEHWSTVMEKEDAKNYWHREASRRLRSGETPYR